MLCSTSVASVLSLSVSEVNGRKKPCRVCHTCDRSVEPRVGRVRSSVTGNQLRCWVGSFCCVFDFDSEPRSGVPGIVDIVVDFVDHG